MKVRINNNQPNAAQRKALRAECVKEFDKLLADYNRQVAFGDVPAICEIKLRESGINVEEFLKEVEKE